MLLKRFFAVACFALFFSVPSIAAQIKLGVSIPSFEDRWLTILRNAMQNHAQNSDIELVFMNAENQVDMQFSHVEGFIADGVDGLIVIPVNTDATVQISDDASKAVTPLVFLNRMPINVDSLPSLQRVVLPDEQESGELQVGQVCKVLGGQGAIGIITGDISSASALMRTKDIHDVISIRPCNQLILRAEQESDWTREGGYQVMKGWLESGIELDGVVANNDEMALGAIQALKEAKVPMESIVVAGIDATPDALASMQKNELDISVYQDANAQAATAIQVVIDLLLTKIDPGGPIVTWIPFKLVVPSNLGEFTSQ
ncbi:substrate-binding domain-containing protein [Neptunomonas phycophila]|uniref:Substrate-binding domain-containing protein n=2 Tax=Neptunomonas phycophila TaxID=1572645 RepID=A0ABT9EQ67_9GAMM|nr:substrate-binding domain-containing protein [Neptunomonas phycophila]MDO6466630.1 substrate-binding domain-containing protein [Neptunomonas phycophila]MDP2521047.1 substrate-binding domain-containing protein [Neptunomonas phycophila]